MTFDEICRRASGRRAYNSRRRHARARRIRAILTLQAQAEMTGRELAARFKVHEATISRDLKFLAEVRREYRHTNGAELGPRSFRFLRNGRDYETVFELRDGVRRR